MLFLSRSSFSVYIAALFPMHPGVFRVENAIVDIIGRVFLQPVQLHQNLMTPVHPLKLRDISVLIQVKQKLQWGTNKMLYLPFEKI